MGIFERFRKRSEVAGDVRRNDHIAALVNRLEGADKKNSARAGIDLGQIIREDAERLGNSILEVYITSVGSAGTWSSDENLARFVKKYNELLAQYGK